MNTKPADSTDLPMLQWDTRDLPLPQATAAGTAAVHAPASASTANVPATLAGRFEGKAAFNQQVLHFLQRAADEGWSELVVGDPDFADWPWGSAQAVDLLHRWARQGRQMTVLANHFDALVRQHPRWVQWRSLWSHKIQCRQYLSSDPSSVPSILWSAHWMVQRLNVQYCVGTATSDRMAVVQQSEALQEWMLHQSTPAFAVCVLGL